MATKAVATRAPVPLAVRQAQEIARLKASGPPRRRGKKKFTIPMAIVAGFVPLVWHEYSLFKSVGAAGAAMYASKAFIPWDWNTGKFDASDLKFGLYPVTAGIVVHKVANKLGLNRALAQANIPWFRI